MWRKDDPLILKKGNKVPPPLDAPLMEVPPQILDLKNKPLQGGVTFGGLKNDELSPGGKLGSYPYLLFSIALISFILAYLLIHTIISGITLSF
jgi:hypothetical protein